MSVHFALMVMGVCMSVHFALVLMRVCMSVRFALMVFDNDIQVDARDAIPLKGMSLEPIRLRHKLIKLRPYQPHINPKVDQSTERHIPADSILRLKIKYPQNYLLHQRHKRDGSFCVITSPCSL
jgi:hypothetical protein